MTRRASLYPKSTDAVLLTLCYLMILQSVGGCTRSPGSWVSEAYAHCSCFRRLLLEIAHASQSYKSRSTVILDADEEVDAQNSDGSRYGRFGKCALTPALPPPVSALSNRLGATHLPTDTDMCSKADMTAIGVAACIGCTWPSPARCSQPALCTKLGLTRAPTTTDTAQGGAASDGVAAGARCTSCAFVYCCLLVRSVRARQVHDASHTTGLTDVTCMIRQMRA